MFDWQAYCKELAAHLIKKHKPTKLEILKLASDGGCDFWERSLPYPLTKKQIAKYYSLGGSLEDCLVEIYKWMLALSLPEFHMDMDFFVLFAHNREFWQLNLEYYKRKQKTIFEVYSVPKFDWETWGLWLDKNMRNFQKGIEDKETNKEEERQMQLLRDYGEGIMEIARRAVFDL